MSTSQIRHALQGMQRRILKASQMHRMGNISAQELSDKSRFVSLMRQGKPTKEGICHLLYMLEECEKFLAAARREKLMRWMGFVQGALVTLGWATIEDLKRLNKGEFPLRV